MYSILEGKGALGKFNFLPFSVVSESMNEDIVLRFFDNCPEYTNDVLDNNNTLFDSIQYLTKHIQDISNRVHKLLEFDINCPWQLEFSDIKTLFVACAFEVSVLNRTDQFCNLFDKEDVEIFEYVSDLSSYYTKGYGIDLSYDISSPLLQDFVNNIDNVLNGISPQIAKLRFAHAETILPFLSILGLYKDPIKLHWDTSTFHREHRQWKTSKLSPFSANVA